MDDPITTTTTTTTNNNNNNLSPLSSSMKKFTPSATTPYTPYTPTAPSEEQKTPNNDSERLSSDLALFLSNPTLRAGLSSGSLDLASYSSTIESELLSLEKECIDVYRTNSSTIASLRIEMDECDTILASLQEMLLGFQADLGGLSGDIKALQEQSRTLGVQLRNRRDAEMGLRRFLERVVVPPKLADVICTGEIDVLFLECVKELETKFRYIHLKVDVAAAADGDSDDDTDHDDDDNNNTDTTPTPTTKPPPRSLLSLTSTNLPPTLTPSGSEMLSHITKLRTRAVSRIRTYFLQSIAELRRPKTNVRMIQVNALLRYAPLADFLLDANSVVYGEVRDVYVESMGKTLYAVFRTYASQLSLLDSQGVGRGDVIAVEDSSLRDVFSSKVNMSKRGDAFYLGERGRVLEYERGGGGRLGGRGGGVRNTAGGGVGSQSGAAGDPGVSVNAPIVAHVALAENKQYPYEVIFKSIMMHLMDAATNEYIFVRQFFKENGPDAFQPIFGRTLNLILEQVENCLFNCYDCLGLLLMIKLTHANRRIMKHRRVDSLDKFFDSVTNLLWPRLKTIMDKQIRSVRDADAKKLGFTDVVTLHAHYVSRRYAEFTCSILQILHRGNQSGRGGGGNAGGGGGGGGVSVNRGGGGGFGPTGPLPSAHAASSSPNNPNEPSPSPSSSTATTTHKTTINKNGPSHRGSAGDMLLSDLTLLLNETVLLLERLADGHSTNKKKIVFLINNIDSIISIFHERRVSGRELNRFVDLLMQQRELFVEEELLQGFSKMIAFVQQTEQHLLRSQYSGGGVGGGGDLDVNVQVVESLVREFASTWKQNIEQVNRNVLSFFANFRNGMEILKQVLTQLLLYYTRFQDIIRKVWRSKPPAFCKDLVSTSTILIEIKKHALAI